MINVGIIGTSGHYMSAIEAQAMENDVKIVSYCAVFEDEDLSFLRQNCKHATEYASYRELLADRQLDAVVICTHFDMNNFIACEALKAGLACYCEKPAFLTFEEESRLANILSKCLPNHYGNMYEMRTMPHFMAAKQYVSSGALGEILLVHSQKSYKLGMRPNFYYSRTSYGGTIPWVGCHAFDLVKWICDVSLEPDYAFHSSGAATRTGEMESSALCVCRFPGGIASFSLDFLRPPTATTHADDRMRIVGTNGTLEVRDGQVYVTDADGSRQLPLPPPENSFLQFLQKLRFPHKGSLLPSAAECMDTAHLAITLRTLADGEHP